MFLGRVRLFATPWTVAYQAPLSMGFSRQGYWSRLPFPSLGDLPNPGIEPRSPSMQADTLPSEPPQEQACIKSKLSNIFWKAEKCLYYSDPGMILLWLYSKAVIKGAHQASWEQWCRIWIPGRGVNTTLGFPGQAPPPDESVYVFPEPASFLVSHRHPSGWQRSWCTWFTQKDV